MNELFSSDHQSSGNGWADQLTAYRQRAKGPSRGFERDASEICAFERPVAVDSSSGAALSPSFSLRDTSNLLIDTSNRWTAAGNSGELFRVGTGTATFNIYLKGPGGSLPLWAIEEDACRSTKSMDPSSTTTNAMMTVNGQHGATGGVVENEPATRCHVVRVPPSEAGSESLVVMVCNLHLSLDESQFGRCADELGRAFAAILSSRLERPLEKRP
jgi:hypothetical protein